MKLIDGVYRLLTGEDGSRRQKLNFFTHVASLAATKTGDGLVDPKLVLSWLLGALGAPVALIGMLVPLREAGALLPQLLVAAVTRFMAHRKWIWALGSAIQGIAVIGIGCSALLLRGAAAGWAIATLVTIFAVARSGCSVSHKDVLGKTVGITTRGTTSGVAGTIGAAVIIVYGLLLSTGVLPLSVETIAATLIGAGCLWIVAGLLFTTLREEASETRRDALTISGLRALFEPLNGDPQLVRFIIARGLLIPSALAPPYMLMLQGQTRAGGIGELGPFVIASALAALSSNYFWGRLSDRSSRRTLLVAGTMAGIALGLSCLAGIAGAHMTASSWSLPLLLFLLMVAYQGVRLGRSTHVVNMATEQTRGAYTALSNTIVGLLLLAGGVFGTVAQQTGVVAVLFLFSIMCLAGAFVARGLDEVSSNGDRDSTSD